MGMCCEQCTLDACADPSSSSVSWCKVEATVLATSALCVLDNVSPPPLVVLSLSMKTVANLKTHQNEVRCCSDRIYRMIWRRLLLRFKAVIKFIF